MVSSEGGEELIKSVGSRERSFVQFVNRTRAPVDIVWKGFNGENIRYASRLMPRRHYSVDTYVLHPWQAWNSDTLNVLNIGGSSVFYPIKWNGQDGRTVVYIDEPVCTLLKLCLEEIKSLVLVEDLGKLEIPRILVEELKKRRRVEVQDYRRGR